MSGAEKQKNKKWRGGGQYYKQGTPYGGSDTAPSLLSASSEFSVHCYRRSCAAAFLEQKHQRDAYQASNAKQPEVLDECP